MSKRESPSYVTMGSQGPMLLRVPLDARGRIARALRQLGQELPSAALAGFIPFCAVVGIDAGVLEGRTLAQAYDQVMAGAVRTRLEQGMAEAYGPLPTPPFAAYVMYCAEVGLQKIQAKAARSTRRKQVG